MMDIRVPFVERHKAKNEVKYVLDALAQPFIDDKGKYTGMCQDYLQREYKCKKAILTQTGFGAIYLSFLALKVSPGDEIIISSYSCPSVLNCVLLMGATPVMCGVDDMGIMTMANIEKATSEKTKAIVVNHHGGYENDIVRLASYCKSEGICLIEDCATAYGSMLNNRRLGTFGTFAILSFNDKKDLCSGEGGALIVNDSQYEDALCHLSKNGIVRPNNIPQWIGMGFSNKVSDVVSSVIYAQLEDAETIIANKRAICAYYRENLEQYVNSTTFQIPHTETGFLHNGNMFFLLFKDPCMKHQLKKFLLENGIVSLAHYGTLETDNFSAICCEGTDGGRGFDERMLRLPVYTSMSRESAKFVVDTIIIFLKSVSQRGEY